jgi:mono/diheme cytochrome c family protein
VVEVPEHLLKRSRERRAALGLGGGEAPSGESPGEPGPSEGTGAQPSSATPAPSAPAAPPAAQPSEPEPPPPPPPYVQAAQQRRRLPWWSLPVFAALPLWAWIFVRTLSPVEVEADALAEGQALFQTCASCHGGSGEGASAPALTDVGETFPDFRDHMMWVTVGAANWPSDTYGAQDLPHTGVMPSYETWTDAEIAQVVLYERQLAGIEATDEEIGTGPDGEAVTEQDLELIAEGELTFADVGVGPESADLGFTEADLEGS